MPIFKEEQELFSLFLLAAMPRYHKNVLNIYAYLCILPIAFFRKARYNITIEN